MSSGSERVQVITKARGIFFPADSTEDVGIACRSISESAAAGGKW